MTKNIRVSTIDSLVTQLLDREEENRKQEAPSFSYISLWASTSYMHTHEHTNLYWGRPFAWVVTLRDTGVLSAHSYIQGKKSKDDDDEEEETNRSRTDRESRLKHGRRH